MQYLCAVGARNIAMAQLTPIYPLQPGTKFPSFTKAAPTGTYSDTQYLGQRYVVYFYPRASTPGCTAQACSLQESLAAQELNIPVLGVSPDPVPKIAKFAEKYGLSFPLLSDEDLSLAQACGVYGDKQFMGVVKPGIHRIAFLIDAQGVVEHCFDKIKAASFAQEVLDYLQAHPQA